MKFNNWDICGVSIDSHKSAILLGVFMNESLDIKLDIVGKEVIISFDYYLSYRYTNESYLLKYWEKFKENKNTYPSCFFTVENSSFINEISELSYDFFCEGGIDNLKHYAVFIEDDCIEILSEFKPRITILNPPASPRI